jgi:hypothetical protein
VISSYLIEDYQRDLLLVYILGHYLIEVIFLQRDLIEYAVEIPRLEFPLQISKVSV